MAPMNACTRGDAEGICFLKYARPDASVYRKAEKKQRQAAREAERRRVAAEVQRQQPPAMPQGFTAHEVAGAATGAPAAGAVGAEPAGVPGEGGNDESVVLGGMTMTARQHVHAAFQAAQRALIDANADAGIPSVVVTYDTECFRRLAGLYVTSSDRVVDVGCSYGVCTAILAAHAGSALGVDIAADMIAAASARHPHVTFERVDILADHAKAHTVLADRNKIFLDIGGNRCVGDVVRAIHYLLQTKPRGLHLIVVKSEELYKAYLKGEGKYARKQKAAAAAAVKAGRCANNGGNDGCMEGGARPATAARTTLAAAAAAATVPSPSPSSITAATTTSSAVTTAADDGRGDAPVEGQQGTTLVERLPAATIVPATPSADGNAIPAAATANPEAVMGSWWANLRAQHLADTKNDTTAPPWQQGWYLKARDKGFNQHSFRYPNRACPTGVLKCRPYNYSTEGCNVAVCKFDHRYCHVCDEEGHKGRDCPRGLAHAQEREAAVGEPNAKRVRVEERVG